MGTTIRRSSTRHSNGSMSQHHTVVHSHPGVEAPRLDSMDTVMRRAHPPDPRRPAVRSMPRPMQQPARLRRQR